MTDDEENEEQMDNSRNITNICWPLVKGIDTLMVKKQPRTNSHKPLVELDIFPTKVMFELCRIKN